MLNYFAEKPKSESKSVSLRRRATALVVALVATSVVYGLFLYSTNDILINQKPSNGLSLDEKQIMWDYMTLNIDELSPEKSRTPEKSFNIDSIKYQDADTALVQYNDGEMFYEADATFALVNDPNTQEVLVDISNFVLVRDGAQPLE
jgi:hypothetical protein